ncbi:Metallophosphoesterase domain-containing protein 1 [Penicillium rolfsii]|nr:Metallophosphoesterase domain-containing protein 1 [Penicillium rolfsii]
MQTSKTTLATPASIKTRFLILSDTHGLDSLPDPVSSQHFDVAIHCGDLTAESKIDEYQASIRLLQALNAPLKLVIAGNHDFTMDIPAFQKKLAETQPSLDPILVTQVYGSYGDARRVLENAAGITFLDEGTHFFRLQNGAFLKVYASSYTPTLGEWGFQYHPNRGHDFSIHNVDVAITHGPPKGVMDYTYSGERAGCPYLFEAISRARPRLHCFGHIHEGWGAKLVTWRHTTSAKPSHLTDIDNGRSTVIDKLSTLGSAKSFSTTTHCFGDKNHLRPGFQTLFVNASIEGAGKFPTQPPWLVELELPPASDQED